MRRKARKTANIRSRRACSARCSSHSVISVTLRRLSSACTFAQSGSGFAAPSWNRRRRKQQPLQVRVAKLRRDRPRDAGQLGAPHVIANRRLPDPGRLAHRTHAEPQLMRQPQHLADLPHRHSHPRHRSSLCFTGTADPLIRMSTGGAV